MDETKKKPTSRESTAKTCKYKGQEYSEGSTICMSNSTYVCRDGTWDFYSSGCDDEADSS